MATMSKLETMRHIGGPVVPKVPGHVPYDRSVKIARLLLERMDGATVWYGTSLSEPCYIEPSNTWDEWVVGGRYPTLKFSFGEPSGDTVNIIARWIDSHPVEPCKYYGIWEENGVIYVDGCDLYITKNMAMLTGCNRNEIAIYNIKTGETVRLK